MGLSKKFVSCLLSVSLAFSSLSADFSEEEEEPSLTAINSTPPLLKSSAATAGSGGSLAVSMMLWGVGLAVGIAALSVLITSSTDGDVNPAHGHAH